MLIFLCYREMLFGILDFEWVSVDDIMVLCNEINGVDLEDFEVEMVE